MALKSGFYNAIEVDGVFDRVYSADEYTNFYSAFLRDGVRRSGQNDFVCTSNGLIITVAAGFAICGSKWINNETAVSLPAVVPPVGEYSRIDRVFLHVDTTEATRAASIVYRQGTAAANPTPPAKSADTGVFELCLCNVRVAPNATEVVLNDTRADSTLCGWITTPVGYDDFFNSLDSAFNEYMNNAQTEFETWFAEIRESLAVATLFKKYTWYIETTATTTTSITFDIPQYDPTGVDIVEVFTNGMLEIENVDYLIDGSTITFTNPKIEGSQILVVVYKSIDGEGLGSVSDEVTALQNQVDAMADAYEFNYICNGETDNEELYNLVSPKLATLAPNGSILIHIYGTFGVSNAIARFGSETSGDNSGIIFWFGTNLGDKRIILDFANASPVVVDGSQITTMRTSQGTFNTNGIRYFAINSNGYLEFKNGVFELTNIRGFSGNNTKLKLTDCFVSMSFVSDYWGDYNSVVAWNGIFERCKFKIFNGTCFETDSLTKLIRVIDCDCYSYAPANTPTRAGIVLHVNAGSAGAVQTERMNCPVVAETGFVQRYAILDDITSNTHGSYLNTITTLPIQATNQNVSGTLNLSIPY